MVGIHKKKIKKSIQYTVKYLNFLNRLLLT